MNKETKIRLNQLGQHLLTLPYIKDFIDVISANVKIASKSKIELLLEYLKKDNNKEDFQELLEEININEDTKAIATYIIQKTILSSEFEKIKIFLLAKIYLYYAKKNNNEKLYIYQNLLTTTDILTESDYCTIYEIENNKEIYFNQMTKYNNINDYIKDILKLNNVIILYTNSKNHSNIYAPLKKKSKATTFMQKMLSLGYFVTSADIVINNGIKDYYISSLFEINDTYKILVQYIKEYFQDYNETAPNL